MYLNEEIPEPVTLYDDYSTRASGAREATMRVGRDMITEDLKIIINYNLPEDELRKWAYQRYIKDYLRVVASVDDNTGRLLDYLDANGLRENTIVIYCSDQGFFLGDHGWYDKRFMYEESFRMPFVLRWPETVKAGSATDEFLTNVDFAPTLLEAAGVEVPADMQGSSAMELLKGNTPEDWQEEVYYRYWMHRDGSHNVYSHYGIRTRKYKLIYYYNDGLGQPGSKDETNEPEWELFDLEKDPYEVKNVYSDPQYRDVITELKDRLHKLQEKVQDQRYVKDN
jgi:arylsulfatase A-like enzyme